MTTRTRYKPEELQEKSHISISLEDHFYIRRYEVTFSIDMPGEPESVVLELVSHTGATQKLRFMYPEFDVFSPISVPNGSDLGPVYVVKKTEDGYEERRSIEVGCKDGDSEPLFWAAKVELSI